LADQTLVAFCKVLAYDGRNTKYFTFWRNHYHFNISRDSTTTLQMKRLLKIGRTNVALGYSAALLSYQCFLISLAVNLRCNVHSLWVSTESCTSSFEAWPGLRHLGNPCDSSHATDIVSWVGNLQLGSSKSGWTEYTRNGTG
jgi:hypothetical protein